jgi:hypothetical protein
MPLALRVKYLGENLYDSNAKTFPPLKQASARAVRYSQRRLSPKEETAMSIFRRDS